MHANDSPLNQTPDNGILDRRALARAAGKIAAGVAVAGLASESIAVAAQPQASGNSLIAPGDAILLQGDSITDAGRQRQNGLANQHGAMGNGYAWLAASQLLVARHGDDLKLFNRGVSGNKVFQLAERWQADCLELKPNVLSILIGVNDIWHALNGDYDGTPEIYLRDYRALLTRTKEALPDVRLIICEPFVLRCGAVDDRFFPQFDDYRSAAKSVADEFAAVWIPFQAMFEVAAKLAPNEYWIPDGVHPSPAGASLMAYFWLDAVARGASAL